MYDPYEFIAVIDPEQELGWATWLPDGSLLLMDPDTRIIEGSPWHSPGMGYSGMPESLEEYVGSWLISQWGFEETAETEAQLAELDKLL